ncbi:hypothetical protein Ahy_A03g014030 isoform B [Arachis hypogaea]|uniref:Uncharacterized protein n=1 Tax=Arachis hypogaea TaxID=3818 RepID=A0A445DX15_ARAHY|nr:hypothetical protein Ahy_A03g014030 isoform B [Arachis hypogaea]
MQHHNKQFAEAKARGEEYEISKLRRHIEMDEYDAMHWRRSFEEREALLRDVSCRKALGLPLEEPGRYVDASHFGKDQFDPENPLYRYDYWGEPKNSEKSRLERIADQHNKSIVGKGTVWYEMSYEDCIKQQEVRKAQAKREREEERRNADNKQDQGSNEDEDSDSDDDFDFSLLRNVDGNLSEQIHVNGTESFKMSDEGMFEE